MLGGGGTCEMPEAGLEPTVWDSRVKLPRPLRQNPARFIDWASAWKNKGGDGK